MIPPFDPVTGDLPPGVYDVTWDQVVGRYGYTPHRLVLLAGLKSALDTLRQAGCERAYIDGSFVTNKEVPNDFDACWEMAVYHDHQRAAVPHHQELAGAF